MAAIAPIRAVVALRDREVVIDPVQATLALRGGNRPGSEDYRPGSGGNGWPGPGGNRPGLGDYRPGAGGNRPDLGNNRPGPGGNRPGLGDYRPGAGGNRPGSGGNRPSRPDYGDNLGIVNRPNHANSRPGGGSGGGWFGNNNTIIVNNGWGGPRKAAESELGGVSTLGSTATGIEGVGDETTSVRGSAGGNGISAREGADPRLPHLAPRGPRRMGLGPWANRWLYSGFINPYFVPPVINTTVVATVRLRSLLRITAGPST